MVVVISVYMGESVVNNSHFLLYIFAPLCVGESPRLVYCSCVQVPADEHVSLGLGQVARLLL